MLCAFGESKSVLHTLTFHIEIVTHSCMERKSLLVSLFEVVAYHSRKGQIMERLLDFFLSEEFLYWVSWSMDT